MAVEYRFAPFNTRAGDGASPGTLEGVAMPYGETMKIAGFRERFEAGAFQPLGDVLCNWQHSRGRPLGRTGGRGLELHDGPHELRATLTLPDTSDGRDVAVLARQGVLTGFSVEFRALEETIDPHVLRRRADVRVVKRARLVGLAIVDSPAYVNAQAALRANLPDAFYRRIWR